MNPLYRAHDFDAEASTAKDYQEPQIFHGVVGWNDAADWFEKGTADNDGHTLVRVQLFEGRDHLQPIPDDGTADGVKLLCHMNAMFGFRIPDKGSRCTVAIPPKMFGKPGAGVIIATIQKNPLLQYDQDRINITFGDDKHVVLRAKSITLTDPGNRYIMIGTSRAGGSPVVMCQDETGSGWLVQSGVVALSSADGTPGHAGTIKSAVQVTNSQVGLVQGSGSFFKLEGGDSHIAGTNCFMQGVCFLGNGPWITTNTGIWGITGVAGAPSPSVFLSPT